MRKRFVRLLVIMLAFLAGCKGAIEVGTPITPQEVINDTGSGATSSNGGTEGEIASSGATIGGADGVEAQKGRLIPLDHQFQITFKQGVLINEDIIPYIALMRRGASESKLVAAWRKTFESGGSLVDSEKKVVCVAGICRVVITPSGLLSKDSTYEVTLSGDAMFLIDGRKYRLEPAYSALYATPPLGVLTKSQTTFLSVAEVASSEEMPDAYLIGGVDHATDSAKIFLATYNTSEKAWAISDSYPLPQTGWPLIAPIGDTRRYVVIQADSIGRPFLRNSRFSISAVHIAQGRIVSDWTFPYELDYYEDLWMQISQVYSDIEVVEKKVYLPFTYTLSFAPGLDKWFMWEPWEDPIGKDHGALLECDLGLRACQTHLLWPNLNPGRDGLYYEGSANGFSKCGDHFFTVGRYLTGDKECASVMWGKAIPGDKVSEKCGERGASQYEYNEVIGVGGRCAVFGIENNVSTAVLIDPNASYPQSGEPARVQMGDGRMRLVAAKYGEEGVIVAAGSRFEDINATPFADSLLSLMDGDVRLKPRNLYIRPSPPATRDVFTGVALTSERTIAGVGTGADIGNCLAWEHFYKACDPWSGEQTTGVMRVFDVHGNSGE